MTDDDLRALLRSAAGNPASPDQADIQRRARRLAAARTVTVAGGVALLAALVVGVTVAVNRVDQPAGPVIGEPPATDESDAPAPPQAETDPLVCDLPVLRPTYLPWLDDGAEVSEPDGVQPGSRDDPAGRLVWAKDPDGYASDGDQATNTVVVATLPDAAMQAGEFPQVDVRGHTAALVWVGDPGIGPVSLIWQERDQRCGGYAVSVKVVGAPDFLGLDEPPDQADDIDAAMQAHQQAIERELLKVAASLVEPDQAAHDRGQPAAPATCRGDVDRRNVAPSDHDRLYLYLPCIHDDDPGVVYRHDAESPNTGDAETDVTALLQELWDAPDPPGLIRVT